MKLRTNLLVVFICTVFSTILFYNHEFGLNLLIFQLFLFLWFTLTKQIKFKSKIQLVTGIGFLLTSFFTVFTHSVFSYFINFLAWLLFIGILNYPRAKSLISGFTIAIISLFKSQELFVSKVFSKKIGNENLGKRIYRSRIFIIPIAIIILFLILYSMANAIFSSLVGDSLLAIEKGINFLFKDIDFLIIFTFLVSLFFSNFFLIRNKNKNIVESDTSTSEALQRNKKKERRYFKLTGLKSEYKSALFLLIVLNFLLLILNGIDINSVWLNFKWEGESLKQFVHDGTYILIFSIIISIALVLYYFRGNLNFFKNNKLLKKLSYIWIFQNGFLAISVGIRNFRYIEHYSLAYKRIGVIIFLLITLYGLYTVAIKIRKKKSSFYLFKVNSLFIYIVLVICSGISWDNYIAKYNFSHYDSSFLHLNYLVTLSNKALPYLDHSLTDLNKMNEIQLKKFSQKESYITPLNYHKKIDARILNFKQEWEEKSILSWNYPEYMAYKKLIEN